MVVKPGEELTLTWTCTTESDHTRLWAIGLRLRCLQKEGHSGVYQTRHRRYHLVSQRQTFQRESLLTRPLRCPNCGVHPTLTSSQTSCRTRSQTLGMKKFIVMSLIRWSFTRGACIRGEVRRTSKEGLLRYVRASIGCGRDITRTLGMGYG